MKAADVMVRRVITVGPDATVQDVADILLANRISAVPVVAGDGTLVGIVSEGDLLRRFETGTERRRAWWAEMFTSLETLAEEYAKSHAGQIADVMSSNVVAVAPTTPLGEIADLFERHRIKRVPVVEEGKLVGIVSRADLLQALVRTRKEPQGMRGADDDVLRAQVLRRLGQQLWAHTSLINVDVHDGTVELCGIVDSASERKAMRVAAESLPGVRAVNENLIIRPVRAAVS